MDGIRAMGQTPSQNIAAREEFDPERT